MLVLKSKIDVDRCSRTHLPYGEDWVERNVLRSRAESELVHYPEARKRQMESNYFSPGDTTRLGIYRFNIAKVESRTELVQVLPRRSNVAYCNGKEKDYESGFHYYGARYYWSEFLTGWLSVDPMADKYPSISPYAKLMDMDGRDSK